MLVGCFDEALIAEAQHSARRILEHELPTLIASTVEQISERVLPDLKRAWRASHIAEIELDTTTARVCRLCLDNRMRSDEL
jgi:hypothetical protein